MKTVDQLVAHNALRRQAIEAIVTLSNVPVGQPSRGVELAVQNNDAAHAVDVTREIIEVSFNAQR
jgi:hypothetical protein